MSNRTNAILVSSGPERSPAAISWVETRRRMDEDWRRLRAMGLGGVGPARSAARWYRISHFFARRGWQGIARFFWQLNHLLNGVDVHPEADLQGGLALLQPAGVSVHADAGRNLTVMALAGVSGGLGEIPSSGVPRGRPVLGDNVHVGHQAGIYGGVRVGSDVYVAPGCFVTMDIESNVTMIPPRIRFQRIPRGAATVATHADCGGDA